MSSLVRKMQKRILTKRRTSPVPVRLKNGKAVGFRLPLCAAHIGYLTDGTPLTRAA